MKVYLVILFLLSGFLVLAQVDTEFWLVIPEASENHGDEPLLLRISTLENEADITVSQPANENFEPINIYLSPNSTETIDLTPRKNSVENRPPNTILNKGILIESSQKITAYYELGGGGNPEIFTLKGSNAIGTDFYIPSQNIYHNAEGWEAFDIVATEDNTTVTITPSSAIVGHASGQPFTITLNRGETYSAQAVSTIGGSTLSGSRVTSDKPVAITISDDSLSTVIRGNDMIGDQLVPVSNLGNEYVVIRGYDTGSDDVFILATQDNTEVFLDGNTIPYATLSEGESAHASLFNEVMLVTSDKPVYVYHVTGQAIGELGSAIIPKLICTGSKQTGFVRVTNRVFTMLLLTRDGNQDQFFLNGSNSYIVASEFDIIPGTAYVYMKKNMSFIEVPEEEASLLSNLGGHFQLGIIQSQEDLQGWVNSEYGYFSDFSNLNLGSDFSICRGDTIKLDAGSDMSSYLWNTGENGSFIIVSDSGLYWVEVSFDTDCILYDTIHVSYYPENAVELGNDTTICQGDPLTLDAGDGYVSYFWQNGLENQTYYVGSSGQYWVQVTDHNSCMISDTINVEVIEFQGLDMGNDTAFCPGGSFTLDVGTEYDTYLWNTGDTVSSITVTDKGLYSLEIIFREVCEGYDEIFIDEFPEPKVIIGPDTVVCEGDQYTINAGSGYQSYQWSTGGSTQSISAENSGTYWVTITDANNCQASDTADIVVNPNPQPDLGEDKYFNDSVIILDAGPGLSGYFWQDSSDNQTYSAWKPGLYYVIVTDENGCTAMDEINLWAISDLVVPNAFTPNGDGINDQFKPAFISYTLTDYKILIFNRWGENIFESTNPESGWDGNYKGVNCPEGSYVWLIEYYNPGETADKEKRVERGFVMLLR